MICRFTLILLLSSLINLSAAAYRLEFSKPGLYGIQIPENTQQNWLVTNGKENYKPWFDAERHLVVYAPSAGRWHLTGNSELQLTGLQTANHLVIERQDVYKYSLPQATDTVRWFTAEVGADEVYTDTLNLTGYSAGGQIKLEFYNLGTADSNGIRITLNGQQFKQSLDNHGTIEFCARYQTDEQKRLSVQLDSCLQNVGLIRYRLFPDSLQINEQTPAGSYLTSGNKIGNSLNNCYAIINGQLQPVKKGDAIPRWLYKGDSAQQPEVKAVKIEPLKKIECDYLIVMADQFNGTELLPELQQLIGRVYPGLKVVQLAARDIFDHYSYGQHKAEALKKYLHSAGLKQVLLLGDANASEGDSTNQIPAFYKIQSSENTRCVTDYPYCYDTDPFLPVIAVSRLPLRTTEELQDYIYKYNRYLQDKKSGRLVLEDKDSYLPTADSVTKVNLNEKLNLFETGQALVEQINKLKPAVLHHIGHGSFSGWQRGKKIEAGIFENLHFGNIFMLVDQSCWTGDFAHPGEDSFAEKLLKLSGRGIVSGVVSSGFTPTDNGRLFYEEFRKLAQMANTVQKLNEIKVKLSKGKINPGVEMYLYNWLGI